MFHPLFIRSVGVKSLHWVICSIHRLMMSFVLSSDMSMAAPSSSPKTAKLSSAVRCRRAHASNFKSSRDELLLRTCRQSATQEPYRIIFGRRYETAILRDNQYHIYASKNGVITWNTEGRSLGTSCKARSDHLKGILWLPQLGLYRRDHLRNVDPPQRSLPYWPSD